MDLITTVLLGRSTGFKLLGIRIVGEKKPGLIDAIAKFGQLLQLFAKVGEIPTYDVDKDGNPKQTGKVKTTDIAKNIVGTLKSFFEAFKGQQGMLDGISKDVGSNIATILLGSKSAGLLGWITNTIGLTKNKPGLLEPILKFSEVLQAYSKMGADGKIATEFDADGKPTKFETTGKLAENVVKGIIGFMNSFSNQLVLNGPALNRINETMPKAMSVFEDVMKKFDKLGAGNLDNIDKLSITLGNLADNIGRLSTNMAGLNINNLNALNAAAVKLPATVAAPSAAAATQSWAASQQSNVDLEILADKIAAKINSSKNGTFDFIFHDTNKGKIEVAFK